MVKVTYDMRAILEEAGFRMTKSSDKKYKRKHDGKLEFINLKGLEVTVYAMHEGMMVRPSEECKKLAEKVEEEIFK